MKPIILNSRKGNAIVGLVIILIVFGLIAAALVSLTSTSSLTTVAGDASTKADFLAQSGYRVATAQYANTPVGIAKNGTLNTLNSSSQSFANGAFNLAVTPYYLVAVDTDSPSDGIAAAAGDTSLTVAFPGSVPGASTTYDFSFPESGQLALYGEYGYEYYDYTGYAGPGSTLTLSTGLAEDVAANTSVLPVTTITSVDQDNRALTLANGSVLPNTYGYFEIEGDADHIYSFVRKDEANGYPNVITKVSVVKGRDYAYADKSPDFSIISPGSTRIIAHTTATFTSTGSYGDATNTFRRTALLGYNIGGLSEHGTQVVVDPNDVETRSNWSPEDNTNEQRLRITSVTVDQNTSLSLVLQSNQSDSMDFTFKWWNTNQTTGHSILNFYSAWLFNHKNLNYDMQSKIAQLVNPANRRDQFYLQGLSFRNRGYFIPDNYFYYGASLFRGIPMADPYVEDDDDAPEWLKGDDAPFSFLNSNTYRTGIPILVLWAKDAQGYRLIATADLPEAVLEDNNRSDGCVYDLKDWLTLYVKLREVVKTPGEKACANEPGEGTVRERMNKITVGIKATTVTDRGTIEWGLTDDETLLVDVVDDVLTSANYCAICDPDYIGCTPDDTTWPHEVGIHVWKLPNAANDWVFDDFSVLLWDGTYDSGISPEPGQ